MVTTRVSTCLAGTGGPHCKGIAKKRWRQLRVEILEPRALLALEPISLADPSLYGASGNGPSGFSQGSFQVEYSRSSFSNDGQLLAFASLASNLVANDTNGFTQDVFVRDVSTGEVRLVSINAAGTGSGNGKSANAQISADGRYVVFESDAKDLVSNDANFSTDVFVRDLIAGTTTLVSINAQGTGSGNNNSFKPAISAEGRFVVFVSTANNLTANDNGSFEDIFVRDLVTGTTSLVSVNLANSGSGNFNSGTGGAHSIRPQITPDGRFVLFVSDASDLVLNDNNVAADVFVRDVAAGTTTLVSVATAGGTGNDGSVFSSAAISDNGRFVVFRSLASNLVGNDDNGFNDIFVRDLLTSTTSLVSVNAQGSAPGNNASLEGAISADGRFVAFVSRANNLAGNDPQALTFDAFVRDLQAGTTQLVSVNPSGVAAGDVESAAIRISSDGRYVAFTSLANGIVAGDTNSSYDLFLRDVQSGGTTLLSAKSNGSAAGSVSIGDTALNRNGTVASFATTSSGVVADDNNRAQDVFVYKAATSQISLVSSRAATLPPYYSPHDRSSSPVISADGRYIFYSTNAADLLPNNSDNRLPPNVIRYDAVTRATELVSVDRTGLAGGISSRPSITPDGRVVAFQSRSNTLVNGTDTNGTDDVFVRDMQTGTTSLISMAAGTTSAGNNTSDSPLISANGGVVIFSSRSSNLLPVFADGNGSNADLFARNLGSGTTFLVNHSATSLTTGANGSFSDARISADGRYVVIASNATDLVAGFVDGNAATFTDILVCDLTDMSIRLVSRNLGGTASGNRASRTPLISPDGRYIAFESDASDLVANDNNNTSDVFIYDQSTATISLVSINSAGTASGNRLSLLGGSLNSSLFTADGRYLLFRSEASDLVSNDSGTFQDVYMRDLVGGTTTLISANASGPGSGNGYSGSYLAFSGNGQFATFSSQATDLVAGFVDRNASFLDDLYVRNLTTGVTTLVSRTSSTEPIGGNAASPFLSSPAISNDGQTIAFVTASALASFDRNNLDDIYRFQFDVVGTIRGQLFEDQNGNHVLDTGEPGLANWRVFLDGNGDGQFNTGDVETRTNPDGTYAFTNLAAGDYTVAQELQTNYQQTLPLSGASYHINLASGGLSQANDFGNQRLVPDLVPAIIEIPTTGTPGREVAIRWTVTNSGAIPTSDQWQDAIYLSADTTLDSSDQLLAVIPHSGALAAGANYQSLANVTLPAVLPSNYYFIVQIDRRRQVLEFNRANNVIVADTAIALDVPRLTLGQSITAAFAQPGASDYYRLDVIAEDYETLLHSLHFALNAESVAAQNELFVRAGGLPTVWDFDFRSTIPAADQGITFPFSDGTYYVLARSASLPTGDSGSYTLLVDTPGFKILSTDLQTADRGGAVTIRIRGIDFGPEPMAGELLDGEGNSFPASRVFQSLASADVFATFDLTTVPVGTYGLRLTKTVQDYVLEEEPVAQLVLHTSVLADTLTQALTITEAAPDRTKLQVTAPASVRPGRSFKFIVTYTNQGTHDVPAPLVELNTAPDILFAVAGDENSADSNTHWVVATAADGPAGTISPGQSGIVVLSATADRSVFPIDVGAGRLADQDGPADYLAWIHSVGGDLSVEPWPAVMQALQDKYGETATELEKNLAAQIDQISILREPAQLVNEILLETALPVLLGQNAPSASSLPNSAQIQATATGNGELPQTIPVPPGLFDEVTNQYLAEYEAWLLNIATLFEQGGAVTAADHVRKFVGPDGPNAGYTVVPNPVIYGDTSPVGLKTRKVNTLFDFYDAHKGDWSRFGQDPNSKAAPVREGAWGLARDYLEEQIKLKPDETPEPPHSPFNTPHLYWYVLGKIPATYPFSFIDPDLADLQFAFGEMRDSNNPSTPGKAELKKIETETKYEGDCKEVLYDAEIHYTFRDTYQWQYDTHIVGASALGKVEGFIAVALEKFGWATIFDTEMQLIEHVKGAVNVTPETECFPEDPIDPTPVPKNNSSDPNELVGPGGFAQARFIAPGPLLPYTIYFENDPLKATAPAQEIFITQQLDADQDWSTFELSDFGFGDLVVTVPAGLKQYQTQIEYHNQDDSPLRVNVEAGLNLQTGVVTWTFRSADSITGLLPEGVFDGFLPVDDETGRGQGFASYFVKPKPGLATGTTLNAQASIVFDINAPLTTNIHSNTIDAQPPASSVAPLPERQNAIFVVHWSGNDDLGGAGLATFDVFVSDNDGPYGLWQAKTTESSAEFTGQSGHAYRFYSVASDQVGNVELAPPAADTLTQISALAWHNVVHALDVTGLGGRADGVVAPEDALAIINYINSFIAGPIPENQPPIFGYLDTTDSFGLPVGDNEVVPGDALAVINWINAFGADTTGPEGEADEDLITPDFALDFLGAPAEPLLQASDVLAIEGDLMAMLAYDAATELLKRRR